MRKWTIALVLLLAIAGTATVAFAQDATPTPVEPASTSDATAAVTDTISFDSELPPQAYVTLDLEAGFALDPFFVSVNGGGETDASTLSEECVGFIADNPVLEVDWEGEVDAARIFFHSDHDSSIVVQLPDGSYVCNGNASLALLDGSVLLKDPEKGAYSVWVGNQSGDGLIPGVLVITTRPGVTAGNFDLDTLISRPPLPEQLSTVLDTLPDAAAIRAVLAAALADDADAIPLENGTDLTATADVTGTLPGFMWPVSPLSPNPLCTGLTNSESELDFTVAEGTSLVRVFFEGDGDASLLVFTPDGDALCTDDSDDGANLNPLLELVDPAPGNYAVVIGRVSPDEEITGDITVTTDPEATPAMLEAPEPDATPAADSN
jgi:hypothetical protein